MFMATGIPSDLKNHLKKANILDDDLEIVHKKMRERTSASVMTYLQLVLLKLNRNSVKSQAVVNKIQNHDDILEHNKYLQESESISRESAR
jgi:hypothetical protein